MMRLWAVPSTREQPTVWRAVRIDLGDCLMIIVRSFVALGLVLACGMAAAKIPAPTLTPEAKAKAAEAAAKTAWSNKVADYQLCKSMDRAAARYLSTEKGKTATPVTVPPCVDPGAFVYVAPDAAPAAVAAPPVAAVVPPGAAAKPVAAPASSDAKAAAPNVKAAAPVAADKPAAASKP
jgi:hypothetical protein